MDVSDTAEEIVLIVCITLFLKEVSVKLKAARKWRESDAFNAKMDINPLILDVN